MSAVEVPLAGRGNGIACTRVQELSSSKNAPRRCHVQIEIISWDGDSRGGRSTTTMSLPLRWAPRCSANHSSELFGAGDH